jgi:hypothetical protein
MNDGSFRLLVSGGTQELTPNDTILSILVHHEDTKDTKEWDGSPPRR